MFLKFLVFTLLSVPVLCDENEGKITVKVENGNVQGYQLATRSGRKYHVFNKIPYAKPPVGPLRFKEPQKPDNWEGVLETNEKLPICWQLKVYDPSPRDHLVGTEDCLYLSVYSPKVSNDAKLPVMMFIHGGGWVSELPDLGPKGLAKNFMEKDVVLVMFHYRLGPLGFLSTEDEIIPGNFGLKDQAMAIKWVSDNIEAFGGDSKKITLFGNSAGGASVHYHLISPMTKDLIQGGISQSGYGTCLWAVSTVPGVQLQKAKRMSEKVGCPTESSQQMIDCLREKTPQEITRSSKIFYDEEYGPITILQPVIESGPNAFLPDNPFNLKVEKPWIVGINSHEGSYFIAMGRTKPEEFEKKMNKGFDTGLAQILMFGNTSTTAIDVSKKIFNRYCGDRKPGDDLCMDDLFSDGLMGHCSMSSIAQSTNKAYYYVFGYKGGKTSLDIMGSLVGLDYSDLGVTHTDELYLLFDLEDDEKPDMRTSVDKEVSKTLIQIWTDFAKYGEPKTTPEWKPFNENHEFLNITYTIKLDKNPWPERVKFWSELPLHS